MCERKHAPNDLMTLVLNDGLHKKSLFTEIKLHNEQELGDFPKLTKNVLEEEIIFGSFQLKHSLSYLAEHFNDDVAISIIREKKDSDFKIITTKIHSRHYSKKEYRVYVSYTPDFAHISKLSLDHGTDSNPDLIFTSSLPSKTVSKIKQSSSITGWYCECKNGTRTLGCCCHVATVIYYLSVLRHEPMKPNKPAESLISVFPKHLKFANKESDPTF